MRWKGRRGSKNVRDLRGARRPAAVGGGIEEFLAGVWAHHAQRRFAILEPGDIEEALNAANVIGTTTSSVDPAGARRARRLHARHWRAAGALVQLGYQTGDLSQGDTFSVPDP